MQDVKSSPAKPEDIQNTGKTAKEKEIFRKNGGFLSFLSTYPEIMRDMPQKDAGLKFLILHDKTNRRPKTGRKRS